MRWPFASMQFASISLMQPGGVGGRIKSGHGKTLNPMYDAYIA